MGIFGSKKKPKDSNYINFNSALNSPYVKTQVQAAIERDLGIRREIQYPDIFRYCGTPRHLLEIEFPSLTLRLCNDPQGDIYADSKRFISDGTLLAFDDSEETSELIQRGMTVKLSDSSDTLIQLFNEAKYLKVPIRGYHAYMDVTGQKPDPSIPFFVVEFERGFIDQPEFTWNAVKGKAEFKITTTSMLERLNNSTGNRTAHALHQLYHPGDNFFKFSNATQDSKKQIWKML
ncbi:hypothetical protein [Aeromonas veronii]|uniref:hypothetical protein n=1 Tax=Aeromonas veronii TaxID=654 RepID=UPI003D246134